MENEKGAYMTEGKKRTDLSIVLGGAAGQGVQTVEKILVHGLKRFGYNVFAGKEYMSRVRGGVNSAEIRLGSKRVSAWLDRIDVLLPFSADAVAHLKGRISKETILLGDKDKICLGCPAEVKRFMNIPFDRMADDVGGKIFINVIAAGLLMGMIGVKLEDLKSFIAEFFHLKGEDIVRKNVIAVSLGHREGRDLCRKEGIQFQIEKHPAVPGEILINGAEGVGIGALAGGCDFVSSYPMSPSTGVLVFMAGQAHTFGCVVEQVEDEIAAINMALGASYAGARPLVTTSGGGFALMSEGVSLAGMIETPVVVHIAQRPGPATGLPTRTEQGDLELVLYAGHGEFPRVILAPGNLTEAVTLTHKAFDLADKFQIPVFILTDQYFVDATYNTPMPDIDGLTSKRHIIQTAKGYRRFRLNDSGISPRGIPGHGEGFVGVDSDEHDEQAHITESMDIRLKMVDKRLRKMALIQGESVLPELVGSRNYKYLLIGWGSTLEIVKEALDVIGRDDIAFLHFKQVYPLPEVFFLAASAAEKVAVIENNATAQLARLIKLHGGLDISRRILKYDGLPFSVEEAAGRIRSTFLDEGTS